MADLLTIWTRVYALHQAMFQKRYWNHGASGPHGDDFELFGLAFILPAFCMPKLPAALAAHLFYVVLKCWRCPFQYNSDVWCTFVDLGFSIAALRVAWRVYVRQGRALSVPLTPAERDAVVHDAAATARPLLGVFYLGAGLFKHNRGHLARQTSCSTVYVIMAAQEWLPEAWLPEGGALVHALGAAAGPLAACTEDTIGLLMLLGVFSRRAARLAVLLGLLLHLFITLVPGVGVPSFSVAMAARYVLFIPDECAAIVRRAAALVGGGALVAAAAALVAFYFSDATFGEFGSSAPLAALNNPDSWVFLGLAAFVGTAAVLGPDHGAPTGAPPPAASASACRPLVALAFTYALLLIPLGLQDMGNVHMFANLHVARPGAGNHIFLPTSLLQDRAVAAQAAAANATAAVRAARDVYGRFHAEAVKAAEDVERQAAAAALAGGTVRIDRTNASFGTIFPGEMPLPLRAAALLRSIGHSGRMFAPLFTRLHGNSGLLAGHIPFMLPALELRRLVAEAKRAGEPFFIDYVRLPSDGYDQQTARDAALPRVTYSWEPTTGVSCVEGAGYFTRGLPCAPTEPALQPWPPPGLLGAWAAKVMLHYPSPLIEGHDRPGVPCHDG